MNGFKWHSVATWWGHVLQSCGHMKWLGQMISQRSVWMQIRLSLILLLDCYGWVTIKAKNFRLFVEKPPEQTGFFWGVELTAAVSTCRLMSYFTPGCKILPVLQSYNHTVTVRTLRTSGGNELLNVCVCVCNCAACWNVKRQCVSGHWTLQQQQQQQQQQPGEQPANVYSNTEKRLSLNALYRPQLLLIICNQ